jgi:hypothetical protein
MNTSAMASARSVSKPLERGECGGAVLKPSARQKPAPPEGVTPKTKHAPRGRLRCSGAARLQSQQIQTLGNQKEYAFLEAFSIERQTIWKADFLLTPVGCQMVLSPQRP